CREAHVWRQHVQGAAGGLRTAAVVGNADSDLRLASRRVAGVQLQLAALALEGTVAVPVPADQVRPAGPARGRRGEADVVTGLGQRVERWRIQRDLGGVAGAVAFHELRTGAFRIEPVLDSRRGASVAFPGGGKSAKAVELLISAGRLAAG